MYSVSQDYLDKLFSGSIQRRITGLVDDVAFTEDEIAGASFSYVDKCVNSADIKLGGVFVGELNLTFLPSFASHIQRGTWRGRVITVYIGLLVDPDNDTWEDIPLKPYRIDEATWSKTGVSVTAYDAMYNFDRPFNMDTTTGTVFDLADYACKTCYVQLGMTQAQMEALPNGTETLGLYPDNDIETWRDLISWIAVTIGGYATINRNGALEFRTWHNTPDITIDINDRYTGGSWSDFVTYYTGLSIVNMAEEFTEYYSVAPDTGLTMNLGSNPLMQYGTKETHNSQVMAVLDALQEFVYTPFSSSSLIDPILDLGDVVEYTNGLAGASAICCVHKMEFKYSKGMKLTGFGKNPALFGARSKTDKNISGLLSKTAENEVITHTFTNSSDIALAEDTETSILTIRFATINPRIVKLLTEVKLNVQATSQDGIVECTVSYYLDDEELTYHPVTTWDNDGDHLLNLIYWLDNLQGGAAYKWEVALKLDGGTATISKEWVHAILEAQGLAATDTWDGIIDEPSDVITAIFGGGLIVNIADTPVIGFEDVSIISTPNDVITAIFGGGMSVNFTENVQFFHEVVWSYWVDDEGDYMTDEDDNAIIFMGID